MRLISKIEPKRSVDIDSSRIGIGFEKLDRNVFDPEKAYDKLAAIGVKWIRIQSGWERTERKPGIYGFEWLDSIVDNLLSRGMLPWICLCYGNDLYDPLAAKTFGSVGCPPVRTEEQKNAWSAYVTALVSHFKGRVTLFEVWNEPDWCWRPTANATEYGIFVKDTAEAIKRGNAEAKIAGGSVCKNSLAFINEAMAAGMGKSIDAITFHEYTPVENTVFGRVSSLRALARRYNPNIEIIQGESGSQSRSDGAGALRGGAWTPLKQAKQLLRHMTADLLSDVGFTSYFSCMDMVEALNGERGNKASYLDYGYFGVLGADFDENGFSSGEYTPKPSYYALANLCSLFSGELRPIELPVSIMPSFSPSLFADDESADSLLYGGFERQDGSSAFAFWKPAKLMTETFDGTITLEFASTEGSPQYIDLMTGEIFDFTPAELTDIGGAFRLSHIPVHDYPCLVTFGDFYR